MKYARAGAGGFGGDDGGAEQLAQLQLLFVDAGAVAAGDGDFKAALGVASFASAEDVGGGFELEARWGCAAIDFAAVGL